VWTPFFLFSRGFGILLEFTPSRRNAGGGLGSCTLLPWSENEKRDKGFAATHRDDAGLVQTHGRGATRATAWTEQQCVRGRRGLDRSRQHNFSWRCGAFSTGHGQPKCSADVMAYQRRAV